jgi:signal transduction histidine kinase
MIFLWYSCYIHDIPMTFLYIPVIFLIFLWYSYIYTYIPVIFMIFLWYSYGIPVIFMIFLWYSYDIPVIFMIFLWYSYDIPVIFMIFLWHSYDIPVLFMIFLWYSYIFLLYSWYSLLGPEKTARFESRSWGGGRPRGSGTRGRVQGISEHARREHRMEQHFTTGGDRLKHI